MSLLFDCVSVEGVLLLLFIAVVLLSGVVVIARSLFLLIVTAFVSMLLFRYLFY